jgi:hypothetical protein
MILIAFDVDGTLSTSAGPVPIETLVALYHPGYIEIAVVSPSTAWPKDLLKQFDRSYGDRLMGLQLIAQEYKSSMIRLYVSDNKDMAIAEAAGYCYIEAAEFAKGIVRPA